MKGNKSTQELNDTILRINVQSRGNNQSCPGEYLCVQKSVKYFPSPKTRFLLNFHRMMAKRMVLGDKILFVYSYRNTVVGRIFL